MAELSTLTGEAGIEGCGCGAQTDALLHTWEVSDTR